MIRDMLSFQYNFKFICVFFLLLSFISSPIRLRTSITREFWLPKQPTTTSMKWWYQMPYIKMNSVITYEPASSLNYAKITNKQYKYYHLLPTNLTTQSVIYITLMEDIYVHRFMLVKNDTYVRTIWFEKVLYKEAIKRTIAVYEEMVYVYQIWKMYGHNICDFLSSLMFVPKELNSRGFYVLKPPTCSQSTHELAKYLGINATFVSIPDEGTQQIFAQKLWVITSMEIGHGCSSGGLQKMRSIIFQKDEYKTIKPERYVVANRPSTTNRYFDDADKLVDILNANTTIEEGCKWVRDDKSYGIPFNDMIRYWMSLKVLVTLQGSGIYNGIFMHENTGMCLLFCNLVDSPNLMLCTHLHIFTIGVIHPDRPIVQDKAYPTNYTDMVTYTQRVVDAVYNGNWTSLDGIKGYLNASYPVTNATYFLYNYKEYARHW